MLIAESTPFLQLQKHKAVLPASNEKEQMWIRNFSLREDEGTEALWSPLCITGRGGRVSGLVGTEPFCWWASADKDFSLTVCSCTSYLDFSSLPVASFVDPQPCAASSSLKSSLLPGWHCLMAHTYPLAMAWLELSESQLHTSQLWTGVFQQKLCFMKPLVHVSFAHFGQIKEMMGLPEKIPFLGSALFPPTSVTQSG